MDGARAFCAKMREFTKELKDEAAKTPGDEEAGLSAEQEEVCDYADSHSRLVYENGSAPGRPSGGRCGSKPP